MSCVNQMRSPEDYAKKSHRWGMLSIGSYAVAIGGFALIGAGILHVGNWILLSVIAGIVCMIATGITLGWWTLCDISKGRYFSHPGQSALIRASPGLFMMSAFALPLDPMKELLFMSGFLYSCLFVIVESLCSLWVSGEGLLPPPVRMVTLTWMTTLYASLSGVLFLAFFAMTPRPGWVVYLGLAPIIIALGGFALTVLCLWSRKGGTPAHLPAEYFHRPLVPRERLTLEVCAVLDFLVIASALLEIL